MDMEQTLDERIAELGAELRNLLQNKKHCVGDRKKLNEKLVALRAAKWIAQRHEAPVMELVKPDEHGGRVDLSFRCANTRYILEHTTTESFPEQRRWTETGERSLPLPAWDDLPECRQDIIRSALFKKLPKLKEAARQERERTTD